MKLKKKLVVVVNGKGGAGKDTVCEIAARYCNAKTVSAITPIKEIAAKYGWKGEKDSKARKFLSDLKRAFVDYNDLPNQYLWDQCAAFQDSGDDVLFVHIRESDQIGAFREKVKLPCVALLVRSSKIDQNKEPYGNDSDDNVEEYPYDYYYSNDVPLEDLSSDFMDFFCGLLVREGALDSDQTSTSPWRAQ